MRELRGWASFILIRSHELIRGNDLLFRAREGTNYEKISPCPIRVVEKKKGVRFKEMNGVNRSKKTQKGK